MAHKDGQYIYTDEDTLGEYEFYVMSSADPVANKTYIHVQCKKGDAIAIQSAEVDGVAELVSFHVDANDTTADVYATVIEHVTPLNTSPVPQPIEAITNWTGKSKNGVHELEIQGSFIWYGASYTYFALAASSSAGATSSIKLTSTYSGQPPQITETTGTAETPFTHDGKTVYYGTASHGINFVPPTGLPNYRGVPTSHVAWMLVYGSNEGEPKDILVGRFAIDLEDAGGTGEDSDWDDPGDEDPPSDEPDPPTYTLHLDVTGALSGRHNDPLNDTSYSYIPDDKATIPGYGCGGDGGHGGGGGGGASTVVVHKFATSRASSKEIIAKARRHGYGSGGGKGGKGGDGCIIIYY